MRIKKISLYQYRNHKNLEFFPVEGKNMIIGKNAIGKTNILEAVTYALTGNLMRQGTEKDLIQYSEEEASIQVIVEEGFRKFDIRVQISRNQSRRMEVNGEKVASFREWADEFSLVSFTPEDLRIAKDSPQYRRRYLNQLLSDIDPAYQTALAAYQKALFHRNTLLKDGARKSGFIRYLNAIDAILIREGTTVMIRREWLAKKITEIGIGIHGRLSDEKEEFSAIYKPDIRISKYEEGVGKAAFVQALTESLEKDIAYKSTSSGPHRDELELKLNGMPLRLFGSQGQQRTAVLTLKLVEAVMKETHSDKKPVLLMDDILSELDIDRQNYLKEMVGNKQALFTGTENPWDRTETAVWELTHEGLQG